MVCVGEIRIFAGNFAPNGWMFCDGQMMSISENEVLFQLIGTTYGGDGQETFALPDMRGRLPVHYGNNINFAESAGVEEVTLITGQIPNHNHSVLATSNTADTASPAGAYASATATGNKIYSPTAPSVALNSQTITITGGSQPHTNMQPYLCVNFIISLYGIYPPVS